MLASLLLGPASEVWAQAGHAQEMEMDRAGSLMVMPTDDAKSFRHIRPAVAALQAKLATLGVFEGKINGLYGPSTRTAVAAYQRQHGLEPTGLPTFRTTLSLRGLSTEPVEGPEKGHQGYAMAAAPAPMEMPGDMRHEMHAVGEAADAPMDRGTLEGDPLPPKMLMLMVMPNMKVENDHTRAVGAVGEFIAGLQVDEAAAVDLDFESALSLFSLKRSEVEGTFGKRIDLEGSPVAPDRALMGESSRRYAPLPDSAASPGARGSHRHERRP